MTTSIPDKTLQRMRASVVEFQATKPGDSSVSDSYPYRYGYLLSALDTLLTFVENADASAIMQHAVGEALADDLVDAVRIHKFERSADGTPAMCRATVYASGWGHVNAENHDPATALAAAMDILHEAVRAPVKAAEPKEDLGNGADMYDCEHRTTDEPGHGPHCPRITEEQWQQIMRGEVRDGR